MFVDIVGTKDTSLRNKGASGISSFETNMKDVLGFIVIYSLKTN